MAKTTVKVEMELPAPPKGYEYTGEYRPPRNGEPHMLGAGDLCTQYAFADYPILRKAIAYREPVLPQDLGKEAEFKEHGQWLTAKLTGIVVNTKGKLWIATDVGLYFTDARIRVDA